MNAAPTKKYPIWFKWKHASFGIRWPNNWRFPKPIEKEVTFYLLCFIAGSLLASCN